MAEAATDISRRRSPLLSPASLTLIVAVALLGVFLSWPTANYSYDAVAYSALIHHGVHGGGVARLWHQYHMLYMPVGYALAAAVTALGVTVEVLAMMQVLNAVVTALGLLLFAALVRRFTGSLDVALAATAVLGLSFAVWYYATDPEVYPPAILFMLLAMWWVAAARTNAPLPGAVGAGLCLGLAVGFHVVFVLVVPAVAVALLLPGEGGSGPRRRIGHCAVMLGLAAVVAVLPYAVYYWQVVGVGLVEGFGERVSWALTKESAEGGRIFFGVGFRPDLEVLGILRGFARGPARPSAMLVAGAMLARVLLVAGVVLAVWRGREVWRRFRWPAVLAVGWLIPFFALFSAYDVGDYKFVVLQLPPLVLVIALAAATFPGRRLPTVLMWCCAGLLLAVNLAGTFVPWSRIENNLHHRQALFIRDHSAAQDLVIQLGAGDTKMLKVYLPYFGARPGLILDLVFRTAAPAEALALVEAQVRDCWTTGGSVYVLSDAMEQSSLVRQFERRRGLRPGSLRRFFEALGARPHARLDSDFGLYVLEPQMAESRQRSAGR
jgi:hypothetical protein